MIGHRQLAIEKATIIVRAKKRLVEPLEATSSNMTRLVTELTYGSHTPSIITPISTSIATAISACTIGTTDRSWSATTRGSGPRSIGGLRTSLAGRALRRPRVRGPRLFATITSSMNLMC
jgi:hypothetical protein